MNDQERRGDGSGYVRRDEFRRVMDRLEERWRRLLPALEFFEAMEKLGLQALLPAVLEEANARRVLRAVASGRWKGWTRFALAMGLLSYTVTVVGSLLAIAHQFAWVR